MTNIRCAIYLAAICWLFRIVAARAADGSRHVPDPVREPLLVVRADTLDAALRLERTKLFRLFNMEIPDYSGRPPVLDVRVASLRRFLAGLEAAGAKDVRFWLSQSGESLAGLSAVMDWRMQETVLRSAGGAGNLKAWLAGNGVETQSALAEVAPGGEGEVQAVLATNAGAVRQVFPAAGGGGRAAGGAEPPWREGIRSFLSGAGRGDFGLWVDPKPVLGLASLLGGFDARRVVQEYNLRLPSSARLELSDASGDLGFTLRLNDCLPPTFQCIAANCSYERPALRPAPDWGVTLALPPEVLNAIGLSGNPLYPANLDLPLLLPRAITFGWLPDATRGGADPDGMRGDNWVVACLLGNEPGVLEQYERLFAWIEVVSPISAPSPKRSSLRAGDNVVRRVGVGDYAAYFDFAEAGSGDAARLFLVISPRASEVARVARGLATAVMKGATLATWEGDLDEPLRRRATAMQFKFLFDAGLSVEPDGLFDAMPKGEAGRLRLDGESLILESPRGLAAWLAPIIGRVADDVGASFRDPVLLTAGRLRHILDIAQQSRFRSVSLDNPAPNPLPESLDELAYVDPDGEYWLNRSFADFPSLPGDNAEVLRLLASGSRVDGYVYSVAPGDGPLSGDTFGQTEWSVIAEHASGVALRINSAGELFRRRARTADWEPYADIEDFFFRAFLM